MNLSEQTTNGVVVIVLNGRIDTDGVVALDKALRARLEADQYQIVLDMAGVQYVNSAALRTLAEAILICREHGGDLKLVALQPKVRRVLQIVGFDRYSAIYETQQAALADF
ncbi:MAG: STAS domain-containing protein [Anaerolineae bacterium]|nr:STAS domain-containing protein [Anaerolineae bacterium]